MERISRSKIKSIVTTNTIPMRDDIKNHQKIKILSVAPLLGEAILRINRETSVSSLFDS
jgi:ribose-phosphate pyrophosphokinase